MSVAYYTPASTDENFRLQCYCGTTAEWSANLSPAVISARFDGAKECWCAPVLSAHRDTHTSTLPEQIHRAWRHTACPALAHRLRP